MRNEETKVVSLVNQKGGVGKTTVTLGFGTELAKMGYKVLLIDFDTQGDLTDGARINATESKTITQAISNAIDEIDIIPSEYIQTSPICDNLDIIPCDEEWVSGKFKLRAVQIERERMLLYVIDQIKAMNVYDFILIDNAGSLEEDFLNSCVACDDVLIVAKPALWSNKAVERILLRLEKIKRRMNPNMRIAGIIFNDVQKNTVIGDMSIDMIKDMNPNMYFFNTYIPKTVKVQEVQLKGVSLSDYGKNSKAGNAFVDFAKEYIEGMEV